MDYSAGSDSDIQNNFNVGGDCMQIVVENHFNLVRFIINRKFNNVPIEYDDLF